MTNKPKLRGQCFDCGKLKRLDKHHYPVLKSEGGTNTVNLCKRCHTIRYIQTNEFALWGSKGGKVTAANPENWKKNLKQYRDSVIVTVGNKMSIDNDGVVTEFSQVESGVYEDMAW